MGKIGKNVIAAIRQPSGGPTMNIKGSAAGGGLSQCIPLTPFSLGLTGDINAIMNAHNLAMVALTSRMQHEFNYNDAQLKKRKLKRLDINPRNVEMKWIIDFCAQALRDITIGQGDVVRATESFDMADSGYDIANDYMYFKAGVYNQNDTGDADDFVQATFYKLEASHDEYNP